MSYRDPTCPFCGNHGPPLRFTDAAVVFTMSVLPALLESVNRLIVAIERLALAIERKG